jgi:hypothetical protein
MQRRKDSGDGFGIKAISCGVPLNTLQQLFGHAQLSITSIYADAMGPEKRAIGAAHVVLTNPQSRRRFSNAPYA